MLNVLQAQETLRCNSTLGSEQKDALSIFESQNQVQTACSLSLSTRRFGGRAHVIFYHKTSSKSHGHGHVSAFAGAPCPYRCTLWMFAFPGVYLRAVSAHKLISEERACCSGTHSYLEGRGPSSEARAAWAWYPHRPRHLGAGPTGALLLLSVTFPSLAPVSLFPLENAAALTRRDGWEGQSRDGGDLMEEQLPQ